jgi:hypothetical protein
VAIEVECTLGRVLDRLRRPRLIWLVVLSTAAGWSCSRTTPQEETAALCEDLGHLADTVSLVAAPPADATVADVRGATEKLDPTIAQAEEAGVVADADANALRADQAAVLVALEGIGDDTPVADLPAGSLGPTATLAGRYADLVNTLGCADVTGY